jgi:hypothetical protein
MDTVYKVPGFYMLLRYVYIVISVLMSTCLTYIRSHVSLGLVGTVQNTSRLRRGSSVRSLNRGIGNSTVIRRVVIWASGHNAHLRKPLLWLVGLSTGRGLRKRSGEPTPFGSVVTHTERP